MDYALKSLESVKIQNLLRQRFNFFQSWYFMSQNLLHFIYI
jgi:hypothetical protein